MISNRCARKSLLINCNSNISKNYLRFLVDNNEFEYRVRYVEPLFLFPVDVWRDLGEWLLCVEKVCICESVKNVLAKLYALPEMEFLLHCNFPKNTLRWKYREIIFVDK